MVGYKKPCKYCGELVDPDANLCPFCGRVGPTDLTRCPKCRAPTQAGQRVCQNCGLELIVVCPTCAKATFFGDYCMSCGSRIMVTCPKCGTQQPPLGDKCAKCKKPLYGGRK